uniref:ABC transporter six-transmembrane domain-containing protein n=1 Tax=uncultured Campylobacter sp. TaxID=218934 RepID=UPI0026283210
MQNSAFKTLTLIAKKNFKKLFLTFSLVLAENGLFLIYPVLAGIAINAIVAGDTLLALSYSCMVFVGWGLGSIRRRVDTQVFTRIYAGLAVSVGKAARVDVDNLAFAAFLPVIYPPDDGHDARKERPVVHSVLAVKVY